MEGEFMDINNVLLNNIEMYSHGKMNFIVGLCEQLNLPEVFNKNLKKTLGRNTDIPYGIMAEMMLVNICDDHHPLYRLDEYYQMKDLEGIFHYPISLSQINDDRFGKFLDAFYQAGARRIFAELSTQAFITYGIEVTNINYDTTSKTMWGTYETEEGKEGVISIDFGHSKQKREDKKQIKIGLGVASGVIVDAKVLSGNKDDTTFNGEILEEVENTLQRLNVSKEDFHYIADSALFTSENLKKAKSKNLKLITRMPETTLVAKKCIREALAKKDDMRKIDIINKQGKTIEYLVMEMDSTYENTNLKCAICYSKNLEEIKKKTIERQIKREKETIEKLSKSYIKSAFACEEDANKEILKLIKKDLKKVKYHTVSIDIKATEKRSRGRQPKDLSKIKTVFQHYLQFEIKLDEEKVQTNLKKHTHLYFAVMIYP